MKHILLGVICLFVFANAADPAARRWSYSGSDGPDNWYIQYPTCKGDYQSPINILTSDALVDLTLEPFTFVNYDKADGLQLKLENDGHAAKVNIQVQTPRVRGGGLPEDYKIAQFHFHWGSKSGQGSEHLVNGYKYPLEMHLVHMKGSESDIRKAANMTRGLAVLGVLFELGGENNDKFDKVFKYLEKVRSKGSKFDLPAFPLKDLLPADTSRYWRYDGGLTTPACYESVIWTVFHQTVSVTEKQLDQLRSLEQEHDGHTSSLADNFRPIAPLKSRKVRSSADYTSTSSAGAATFSIFMITAASLASLLLNGKL